MNESWKIAYLEARVASLEKRLSERSATLRIFTRQACDEDVINAIRRLHFRF